MSIPLPTVLLLPGATQQLNLTGPSTPQALKVSNKSPYDVQYSGFGVIGADWIPSGTEYMLYAAVHNVGDLNLTAYNNANIVPATAGAVLVTEYVVGEQLPVGHWPVSIPFQTVTASGGVITAQQVINDGNVAGTTFVESTVAGDPSSSVKITNDAQITFGSASHNATITTTGTESVTGEINSNSGYWIGGIEILTKGSDTQIGAPNSGNLIRLEFPLGTTQFEFDQGGHITGVNGIHVGNGSWQVAGDDGGNTNIGNSSVNTFIKTISQTQFQINGADCFDVNGNGPFIPSGKKYQFIVGTMSQQNGSISNCGSGTTISHGLTVGPPVLIATPVGNQAFSATVGVGNIGSSTFRATVGAGSQICWWALAG